MPKYLFEARYTPEGAKAVLHDGGTARRKAVEATVAAVGGKLETFYYAFGDVDSFVIAELPDNATAAAVALTVSQAGKAGCRTTVLMTPEDVDRATKISVPYKPPGS